MATRWPWVFMAGVNGLLAVIASALAAHLPSNTVDDALNRSISAGTNLHLVHAAALLACSLVARDNAWLGRACAGLLAGCVLFSGSLYLIALTGWSWLGPVTPFGGLAFMIGWACVAIMGWQARG